MIVATSLAAAGASLAASAALTGLALRLLRRRRVLDRPNERSSHKTPVPRGGGLAVTGVALALWLGLWLADACAGCGDRLWILVAGGLALACISWADDLRGLPPLPRLAVQAAAVGAGIAALPGEGLVFQGLLPAVVDHALAALLWLWFVNLFNFMDGIDGITGVQTATLGTGAFLLALLGAAPAGLGPLGLGLAGVAAGFLLWNRPPAKIFLGDVGSVPLGYLAGWLMLALACAGLWQAALLLPAYYLADATFTMLARIVRGRRIWEAHREHFYQRAVAAGWSHGRTTASVGALNLLLAGLALAAMLGGAAAYAALAAGAVLVGAFLCYLHVTIRTSCASSV